MAIGNLCSFLKLYNFTNRKWNALFPYWPAGAVGSGYSDEIKIKITLNRLYYFYFIKLRR